MKNISRQWHALQDSIRVLTELHNLEISTSTRACCLESKLAGNLR